MTATAPDGAGAASGPWLPPGPWPVVPGYAGRLTVGAYLVRVVASLIAIAGGVLVQSEVPNLLRDARLTADPAAIEAPAVFDGTVASHFGLLATYRGKVRFEYPTGVVHTHDVDFSTFVEVDTDVAPKVRFVPATPDEFVLNWAAEALVSRWALLALLGAFLIAGMPLMFWWLGKGLARRAAIGRALAKNGEERVGRLVAVRERRQHGKLISRTFTVAFDLTGGVRKVHVTFAANKGIVCRIGDDGVLAAWSPDVPDHPLPLRDDLWPLQLPADTVAAVRARIDAAS